MSDDRVYIRFKGKTLGPFGTEKVQGLIKRGQITRMHELSSDGLAWTRAEDFANFFPKPMSETEVQETLQEPVAKAQKADNSSNQSQPRPGVQLQDGIEWYAHLNNQSQGPMTTDELYGLISSGTVIPKTLVWRSGFDDWRSAESALPDRFRNESVAVHAGPPGGTVHNIQQSSVGIGKPLTESRGWVTFLAISGIVYGAMGVLYFIIVLIASANRSLTPFEGTERVIYGLFGIGFNSLFVAGAILLLRYSMSLKKGPFATESDLLFAARRLKTFWSYTGVVVLVLEVLMVGLIAVIAVISAADTDS